MPFPRISRVLLTGVAVAASASWAAAGPVVYTSQSRTVEATLTEVFVDPELVEDVRTDTETASAPDFNDFSATVAARIDNPPFPSEGESNASMQSRLNDAGITASGSASGFTGTAGGEYAFRAAADVTFVLDETRNFTLDYLLGATTFVEGQTSQLRLTGPGDTVVFDEALDFTQRGPDDDLAALGNRSGTLAAGTYRFQFVHGFTSDSVDTDIPYSVSLALEADDGGPAPNPIPLPPAAWAAVVGAGGLGALRHATRFVRRRK